jgi:hypothetical protein
VMFLVHMGGDFLKGDGRSVDRADVRNCIHGVVSSY